VATGKVLKRLSKEACAGLFKGVRDRRCPPGRGLSYLSEQWKGRMEEKEEKGFRRESTTALSHSVTSMFVHTLPDRSIVNCQLQAARKWLLCLSFGLHSSCLPLATAWSVDMYGASQYSCPKQDAAYRRGSGYVQRGSSHTHNDGVDVLLDFCDFPLRHWLLPRCGTTRSTGTTCQARGGSTI